MSNKVPPPRRHFIVHNQSDDVNEQEHLINPGQLIRYPMSMKLFCLFLLFVLLLTACSGTNANAPTFTPPIVASPITVSNAEGTPISQQPGFVEWVLLSGVDEHGLTAEHSLILLADADSNAPEVSQIHTGHPVMVLEIRQVGPQGLQRFYYVQTLEGITGWISDYYVRRQAYLFNHEGTTVSIYDKARGAPIAQLANVTPITLRQPQELTWWQVSTLDGNVLGWVESRFVKESPEEEFLLGEDHEHPCEDCPYFLP